MGPLVFRLPLIAVLALLSAPPVSADYTYQETTQITGGTIVQMMHMMGRFSSEARKAGEPIVSTIYLKGNRMATVNPDSIQIIDLDKETMTDVDPHKKTYTVVTFDQLRQQIQMAAQQMQKQQAEKPVSAPPPEPKTDDVKVSFDVKVRKTGVEKQIEGLSSQEAILTMTMNATDTTTQQSGAMAVTNDMWMVPEIPGYNQVRDFQVRFAEKMSTAVAGLGMDVSQALAQHPGATVALADMGSEMRKLSGVPIQQIMRMGTTMNGQPLPAASEAPLPPDNSPPTPSAGDVARQSVALALTSRLPFGGFGHKKKQDDPPPADQNANPQGTAQQPTSAILMESQTTVSNFSSAPVDDAHFEVPAGFRQVQPPTPGR